MSLVTSLFTTFVGYMTEIVTMMTTQGNEIMLIPLGLFVVGGVIGLAKKLLF